ncbi:MAG TPA: class E sortase [Solirubrobacteraceae bacterium]|jgi:sortase A|nr:class E sortase [Solirubrobacteraceae bacterium]
MTTAAPRRARLRRSLRVLSSVLIVAGAVLLADAVATLLWQEPVSAVYAHFRQQALDDRLEAIEQTPLEPAEERALRRIPDPRRRLAFRARALERRIDAGDPMGRIVMPAIGVSEVFVQGTGTGDLRGGPGHYPDTPFPGERGTVAIAGHRTTYGAPFRRIDKLDRGDRLELRMPYGRFTYVVERTKIVPPTEVSVTDRVAFDRLVLSACHPLYSAAQRIIVFARLREAR